MAEEEVRKIKGDNMAARNQSCGNARLLVRFFSVSLSVTLVIIGSFFSFFIVILSPSTSLFKGQKEKYCLGLKWCYESCQKGLPVRWGIVPRVEG